MVDFSGIFKQPFNEQVAAFRLRLQELVPTARWDDIDRNAHDRAFMVAGAAKADLLADLAEAVDRAIAEGTGFDRFKADFRYIVERHGWHGWTGEGTEAGEAWRMRTIYRTNMATTYAAGRFAQLRKAGFKYWVYRHGGSEHPRLHHLAWDGLILPADHEFWLTHYPPNGWGCSCYAVGAHSLELARLVGGDPSKSLPDNWRDLDPKTGAPIGVGRLWDYAPGSGVADTVAAIGHKLVNLPGRVGADMMASFPDDIARAQSEAFADFVDEVLADMPRKRLFVAGALKPHWIDGAQQHGVVPVTADIAVTDEMIWHAFRDAKAHPLPLDWYKMLPRHLRSPSTVLLDTSKERPSFLLFLDVPGGEAKLVVQVNFDLKKKRGVYNVVRTGSMASERDIKERIGSGAVIIEKGGA